MNKINNRTTGTKLLALLLVVVMMASLLPIAVFAASATDGMPSDGTTTGQPFVAGQTGGSNNNSFRIPAMVTLDDGTIVAAADARWNEAHDGGGNDTIVSYSNDNGKTWNYTFANYMGDNNYTWTRDSTTFIDPALATDGKTVYMIVDLFVHGRSNNNSRDAVNHHITGNGFNSNGYLKLAKGSSTNYNYYLKDGKIYDSSNQEVSGYTVDEYFNITGTDGTSTNLFFADSPYQVYPTAYDYITKSEDGGKTWSEPTLICLNDSSEYGCLVGAGQGVVTQKGTIIFPFYDYPMTKLGFIYSTDNGATWQRSDGIGSGSESTIIELNDGTLRVVYRHSSGNKVSYVDVKETAKGSFSWGSAKSTTASDHGDCQHSAMKYSKTVDGHEVIIVSTPTSSRTTGYLYLFDATDMTLLDSYKVNTTNYQYSALAELNDGSIALLYETHSNSATVNGTISFATYDPAKIFDDVEFDEAEIDSPVADEVICDTDTGVKVDFDNNSIDSMTVTETTVENIGSHVAYDVTPGAGYDNTGAAVTLPLGELSDVSAHMLYGFYVENGKVVKVSGGQKNADGTFTFTVPHFSVVGVAVYADGNGSVDVVVYEGGKDTVELEYAYDASYTDGNINNANYTASWTVKQIAPTEASSSESAKVTTPESGKEYYISDGTNYLTLSGSTLGITDKSSEATKWIFTSSGSGYTIKSGNYYLSYESSESSDIILSTSYTYTLAAKTSSSVWTCDANGIHINLMTKDNFISSDDYSDFYLNYSSEWKMSTSASSKGFAYSLPTNIPATEGKTIVTLTVKGLKESTGNSFELFGTAVTVTVKAAPQNQGDVTLAVNESKNLDLPIEISDEQTVVWAVADNTYVGIYSENGTTATLYGREEGSTTATATVYNADGTIASTYTWNVTVTEGDKHNAGNYDVKYTVPHTVYNGRLYYALSGGTLKEATLLSTTTDDEGNIIRSYELTVTETDVSKSQLEMFIAPDEGYAVSLVSATQGTQYYAIDKEAVDLTIPSTHSGDTIASIVSGGDTEAPIYKALLSEAIANGCDAVYWFSRKGLTSDATVSSSYTVRCDKLPTVDKEVSHLVDKNGSEVTFTNDGMIVDPGYKVVFKITVTGYPENASITYTDGRLYDRLSGVTLYSDEALTKPLTLTKDANGDYYYDITSTIDASRTDGNNDSFVYYAAYTLTEDDVKNGKNISNTVDLSYNYKSQYSTGTFGGEAKAKASFKLTDFPVINDIVADFGLPIKILDGVTWAKDYNGIITINSADASYGKVEWSGDNKTGLTLTYTLTEMFTGIDTVTLYSSREGNKSTFRVIPATTVYYEDGFVSTADGAGNAANAKWETVGTAKSGTVYQALEFLGESKNLYGYDSAYADSSLFSMGTAKKVTVTSDMPNNWADGSAWPTASFTFKGTGFDLISLTDNDSGLITYTVTDNNGTVVLNKFVVNYYGYTYDGVTDTWTQTNDTANALYQIPVVMERGLAYGEYTITISVAYAKMFDKTGDNQYSFWLDAVRVYDTLDVNYDEYAEDGEAYPIFFDLRDAVANTDKYSAVLIEGKTEATLTEYTNIGPNHEVYLAPGQSIAFKLNGNIDKIASVQLGAKAVGGTARYLVNGENENVLATATDMYYDITAAAKDGKTVIITNSGDTILSLTHVKVTKTEKISNVTLGMTAAEAQQAVFAVRAMFAMPVEPAEPFEPEYLSAKFSPALVVQGKTATLTVTASEDVEAICVDGEIIETYKTRTVTTGWGANRTTVTYHVFTYSVTADETADFSISAFNADGAESEAITATLTVWMGLGNWFKDIIGRFF